MRRQAARRFGVATGDALAALLANEEDVERLAEVGDLVGGCVSAEELRRRGRGLLNGGSQRLRGQVPRRRALVRRDEETWPGSSPV